MRLSLVFLLVARANGYDNPDRVLPLFISESQREKAQEIAIECVAKNYKGC